MDFVIDSGDHTQVFFLCMAKWWYNPEVDDLLIPVSNTLIGGKTFLLVGHATALFVCHG